MTINEFAAMSFVNCRAELWRGEIVRRPFWNCEEGVIGANVMCAVANWNKQSRCGRGTASGTGFVVGENSVLTPAGAFTSFKRIENHFGCRHLSKEFLPFAPDLAVEIATTENQSLDIEKIDAYFTHGTRLIWFVYPLTKTIYVTTSPTQVRILETTDQLDGGDVLPGFTCAVAELFDVD